MVPDVVAYDMKAEFSFDSAQTKYFTDRGETIKIAERLANETGNLFAVMQDGPAKYPLQQRFWIVGREGAVTKIEF